MVRSVRLTALFNAKSDMDVVGAVMSRYRVFNFIKVGRRESHMGTPDDNFTFSNEFTDIFKFSRFVK
ncbi:MAG: hypothetical protein Hyperionvirus11_58 [Hyperionvirus sp.]|uniref:Uncharacterized protein n=1 Tax=Hyperionvirus sp. TaxID=2487770 RepID=A0A3G5A972_9VIRU|nr:MAG: hypothetical protein Hyperionvirus11_58 [Hyperionvirus sp.]